MEITIKINKNVNEQILQKIVSYAIVLGCKVNFIGPKFDWVKKKVDDGKLNILQE